jgi:hypothetical protein
MFFTCIFANANGVNRTDSAMHRTICRTDTICKDEPVLIGEKLVLIVEDEKSGKTITWIEKYEGFILGFGGIILGCCLGLFSFWGQQRIVNSKLEEKRKEEYKHAINNYIDYITSIIDITPDERIELAKNLIYPTEGLYIKESRLENFKPTVDRIKNLLILYGERNANIGQLNVELKELKFKEKKTSE